MPKRGENIHKRKDGRWEARFIDFYTENGEAHYKSIYGKSYTEVKSLKNTINLQKDKYIDKNTISSKCIINICDDWLVKTKIKLKESTYTIYHRTIQNHIIPYFKDIELKTFNNKIIQQFISDKYSNGLSAKTIRDIISILFQIIKYAETEKYISNFNYDVEMPKIQQKEYTLLSMAEQKKLIDYINKDLNIENFGILLTMQTGIRLGELCALKWIDINIETETLSINKTIQRIKNFDVGAKTKIIIDKPKSQKSIRDIPLSSVLIPTLKNFYNIQNPDTYILTRTTKYIEPRTYQAKFKRYLKEANVRNINFHSLRYTNKNKLQTLLAKSK